MPDTLARILAALRSVRPDLDGTALAEAVWLAAGLAATVPGEPAHGRGYAGADTQADTGTEVSGAGLPDSALGPEEPPVPGPFLGPEEDSRRPGTPELPLGRPLYERLSGDADPVWGDALAISSAAALPHALEIIRALRPWKRRWPQGRQAQLDIGKTVDAYARSGELNPVLAAAPERWFDLVLVLDRTPTMAVWQDTLADFTGILKGLGAFRTLQVRDLAFDEHGRPTLTGRLPSADGRSLVLVVSDCTAAPWRQPDVWQLLRQWAAATPTALLNPLPPKVWRRTGLNLPVVRFSPTTPGACSTPLPGPGPHDAEADAGAWLPVPVLTLSPYSLGRWSRAVMRSDPTGCNAVLVPPQGRTSHPVRPYPVLLPPAVRARGFLRTAAPRAARLAVLCSALAPG